MTIAVDKNQGFCFPLPDKPRAYSWGASDSDKHVFNSNHSRHYTVCLEPEISNSCPKKHSHRRSGAISHDFSVDGGLEGLDIESFNKKINFPIDYTAGTVSSNVSGNISATNNSSPPVFNESPLLSSDMSTDDSASPNAFQFGNKVAFPESQSTEPKKSKENLTKSVDNEQRPQEPHRSSSKRHTRVKSWAGTVIRLTKLYNSQDRGSRRKSVPNRVATNGGTTTSIEGSINKPRLFSSSYVSEDSLKGRKAFKYEPEPEPLIDLDLAFTSMVSHRRSGSAPESVVSIKNSKPKMASIENAIEEEEEDEEEDEMAKKYKSFYRVTNSGNGSAVSVYSGQSYDRNRYRRSKGYNASNTSLVIPGLRAETSTSSLMPPPTSISSTQSTSSTTYEGKGMDVISHKWKADGGNRRRSEELAGEKISTGGKESAADKQDLAADKHGLTADKEDLNEKEEPLTPRTDYEDTFYLGGPGYARYSVESDRYSCSTLGTFSSAAPASPTHSRCGDPQIPISSFETGPLSSRNGSIEVNSVRSVSIRRRLGNLLDRWSRR